MYYISRTLLISGRFRFVRFETATTRLSNQIYALRDERLPQNGWDFDDGEPSRCLEVYFYFAVMIFIARLQNFHDIDSRGRLVRVCRLKLSVTNS